VLRLGLPDRFIDHGDPVLQLASCGLNKTAFWPQSGPDWTSSILACSFNTMADMDKPVLTQRVARKRNGRVPKGRPVQPGNRAAHSR
jgi:hypothetical protein